MRSHFNLKTRQSNPTTPDKILNNEIDIKFYLEQRGLNLDRIKCVAMRHALLLERFFPVYLKDSVEKWKPDDLVITYDSRTDIQGLVGVAVAVFGENGKYNLEGANDIHPHAGIIYSIIPNDSFELLFQQANGRIGKVRIEKPIRAKYSLVGIIE
ncbi:MAG: hypothetical protein FWH56_04700 [Betaproteobacteria bacterium]|nr:hypothetical protein [Betaproteobacteria bacterium]